MQMGRRVSSLLPGLPHSKGFVPPLLLLFCFSGEQEQSFATNHMETGVHIGKGTVQHLPEDYVVPLFKEGDATFWRRESLLLPKVSEREYLASQVCSESLLADS